MVLENGAHKCNCPRVKCDRHGKCEACMKHHEKLKRAPYCTRHRPKDSVKK